jgi:hypothetical protein
MSLVKKVNALKALLTQLVDFRILQSTVNTLSITPEISERTRCDGSCYSPLSFLTGDHDILFFKINDS